MNDALPKDFLKEAQDWLKECYPDDQELIEDLGVDEAARAVEKLFSGGLKEFLKCSLLATALEEYVGAIQEGI